MALPAYLAGGMLSEKFELIERALKTAVLIMILFPSR